MRSFCILAAASLVLGLDDPTLTRDVSPSANLDVLDDDGILSLDIVDKIVSNLKNGLTDTTVRDARFLVAPKSDTTLTGSAQVGDMEAWMDTVAAPGDVVEEQVDATVSEEGEFDDAIEEANEDSTTGELFDEEVDDEEVEEADHDGDDEEDSNLNRDAIEEQGAAEKAKAAAAESKAAASEETHDEKKLEEEKRAAEKAKEVAEEAASEEAHDEEKVMEEKRAAEKAKAAAAESNAAATEEARDEKKLKEEKRAAEKAKEVAEEAASEEAHDEEKVMEEKRAAEKAKWVAKEVAEEAASEEARDEEKVMEEKRAAERAMAHNVEDNREDENQAMKAEIEKELATKNAATKAAVDAEYKDNRLAWDAETTPESQIAASAPPQIVSSTQPPAPSPFTPLASEHATATNTKLDAPLLLLILAIALVVCNLRRCIRVAQQQRRSKPPLLVLDFAGNPHSTERVAPLTEELSLKEVLHRSSGPVHERV